MNALHGFYKGFEELAKALMNPQEEMSVHDLHNLCHLVNEITILRPYLFHYLSVRQIKTTDLHFDFIPGYDETKDYPKPDDANLVSFMRLIRPH